MTRILIVEDEESYREPLVYQLTREGYDVSAAATGEEGLELFTKGGIDLVLLDLMLPGLDGTALCRRIREQSRVPIIMLTAKSAEIDKVVGLEIGADDYITKPYSFRELLARIRMVLRNYQYRADSGKLPGGTFRTQTLLIDYDARRVFVHGREVGLSQTEYNIVAFLSEHCGKMMTYSAIIREIWGYADEGSVKKLQVNMANIRRKFGVKPGQPWCIANELGVGYRMNGDSAE